MIPSIENGFLPLTINRCWRVSPDLMSPSAMLSGVTVTGGRTLPVTGIENSRFFSFVSLVKITTSSMIFEATWVSFKLTCIR